MKIFTTFLFVLCLFSQVYSSQGITGLVIDQTRSRVGEEFYREFRRLWEQVPYSVRNGFNVVISEFYDPKYGFVVEVKVEDTLVWQGALRPRDEEIKERAREAVRTAIEAVSFLTREQESEL